MKLLISILALLMSGLTFSQNAETIRKDSVSNYELRIPSWLKLRDTGSSDIFGGTLPTVKGIENAITIRTFAKSSFKTFDDFKDVFLTGNKFGQPTKFNKEQVWYGQKDLIEIEHGVKQRVFIFWNRKIYHDQFVLLQTSTAFLLIQFVATEETYDINISRFNEFLSGLTIN